MIVYVLVKTETEQARVIRAAIRQSGCEVTSVVLLWGGHYDLLVTMEVDTLERMENIVICTIQQLTGVCRTMTLVQKESPDE